MLCCKLYILSIWDLKSCLPYVLLAILMCPRVVCNHWTGGLGYWTQVFPYLPNIWTICIGITQWRYNVIVSHNLATPPHIKESIISMNCKQVLASKARQLSGTTRKCHYSIHSHYIRMHVIHVYYKVRGMEVIQ